MPSLSTEKPSKVEVFRIQDRSGRGPWRPGLSEKWVDPERTDQLPNIFNDFGHDILSKIRRQQRAGFSHCGCACRSVPQLMLWFSKAELERMLGMGFKIVCLSADVIIGESQYQTVFGRTLPFSIIKHDMVVSMSDINKYKIVFP